MILSYDKITLIHTVRRTRESIDREKKRLPLLFILSPQVTIMNISIAPKKKKPKNSIGYGLNNRGASAKNVFGESSSDEDDEDGGNKALSNKGRVNLEIAKEQAALRKRAQAAAASMDTSVYDYDGQYDSFKASSDSAEAPKEEEERKSRYIGDLLKAAKKRERERDIIYERKVAKEQAEEDAQADYQGKEKFVTKAYKRKLEERKQWEKQEKEKEREEEANDVTKKSGGAAFASFYGNFNRNVAMGGKNEQTEKEENQSHGGDQEQQSETKPFALGFMSGFERSSSEAVEQEPNKSQPDDAKDSEPNTTKDTTMSIREKREQKVREARQRYLERKGKGAARQ